MSWMEQPCAPTLPSLAVSYKWEEASDTPAMIKSTGMTDEIL